jgi:hypothetical protein
MKKNCLALSLAASVLFVAVTVDAQAPPPWERTETRTDCTDFQVTRQPLFGDTHVHTAYSFDAFNGGIINGPRISYDYAMGASIGMPPYDMMGLPTRTSQLRRPLDYTLISDHAELFGEVQVCYDNSLAGYSDPLCVDYRANTPQLEPGTAAFAAFVAAYFATASPVRHAFCGPAAVDCLAHAAVVWQDIQDAAEEKYDRSASCTFTSFVGYEYTGAPAAQNIHRNIMFRNENVPDPTTYMDEQKAPNMHAELETTCINGIAGCDVLAIPHNSNLSGSNKIFEAIKGDGSPMDAEAAALQARMEPVVEIYQHKGDSECHLAVSPTDEQCGFEKFNTILLGIPGGGGIVYPPLNFTRGALKEGLALEQTLGVNPWKFGLVGSTDTHGATPGLTHETDFATTGHLGTRDDEPDDLMAPLALAALAGSESSGGGLAVAWAEENSRDSIFSAYRRREVYATSGTRPLLRFFAGVYKDDLCAAADLADAGYRRGVPMGGEIGAIANKKSPTFVVQATKDPGPVGGPSTQLQQIQIIKGSFNPLLGLQEEVVVEIAGDSNNGASVDEATCISSGVGFDSLCETWTDPDFDPSERAFYYARVIENPVCRWHQPVCNGLGIDCAIPATIPVGMEECCNVDLPNTIQERAWSSPIWYKPESFSKFKSKVKLKGGGADSYKVSAKMQAMSSHIDPDTNDITLTVSDDDTIYTATIPAGTMTVKKPGAVWTYVDKTGALDGISKASVKIAGNGGGKFQLKTIKMDLSNANPVDHFVHSALVSGPLTLEHQRLWESKGTTLKNAN